ncbi:PREDICTED: larval serum protein 1 alpha chain-like [Rhagoletis zephyria]|uniref:larval serum protein 1 alpha chain-like n=1 Tax=Rhagoletis zephyria TaxID=28612 RepID=UPI0008119495|nr:PREDICTED: larval serum protein 1 alpha chain-like [Rhagoletis zephyria]
MTLAHTLATGYNPQLVSWNGLTFWQRYNNYEFGDYGFPKTMDLVFKLTNEIYRLADTGAYWHDNGTLLDLHQPAAQKHFYNIIHGNRDALEPKQHQTYWFYSFMYLAQVEYEQFSKVGPQVLLNYETALRDPIFYTLMKYKVLDMWNRYIVHFAAYTADDLRMVGVALVGAKVDPMRTFFKYIDIDVNNLWSEKLELNETRAIYARQQRLTHKPFSYTLDIQSDVEVKATINVYIAPKYNERAELITLTQNRENFLWLDEFEAQIKVGFNAITHPEFLKFPLQKRWSFTEMYNVINHRLENGLELPKDLHLHQMYFSRHMNIPRGTADGFAVVLCFVVTPSLNDGDMPLGYPFERVIEHESAFQVQNVYFKDAIVYHVNHNRNIVEYVKENAQYEEFDYNY